MAINADPDWGKWSDERCVMARPFSCKTIGKTKMKIKRYYYQRHQNTGFLLFPLLPRSHAFENGMAGRNEERPGPSCSNDGQRCPPDK